MRYRKVGTLEKIAKSIGHISYAAGYGACFACLMMLALVLAEIFVRTFLHFSLLLTLEVCEWLLIATAFMGTAWTLKDGGHVRINLITSHLSQRAQHWVTISAAAICIAFFIWFSLYAWQGLVESYVGQYKGYSPQFHMPVWWAWVSLCVGAAILTIQFVGVLLEGVVSLKRLGYERVWTSLAPILLVAACLGVGIWIYNSLDVTGLSWGMILLTSLLMVFALIGSSLWISMSLALAGMLALSIFTSYPVEHMLPQIAFSSISNFILVAVPLFIFMGELLYRSGASSTLYTGVSAWAEKVPGRLLHSNIVACTIFAAISGSSAVTCATIGSVAVPELEKRSYDRRIAIGSLAGAGTLGLLIPPSIMMIVYGALTASSIGQLFAAGIIPGLMIAALFMIYIGVAALRQPLIAPPSQAFTWRQRMVGIVQMIPMGSIIMLVLGLIYLGITTPTEAAAIGSACAILMAAAYRKLTLPIIRQVMFATIRTTCMCLFIYIGASFLSSAMAYLLIPQALAAFITAAHITKYTIFAFICFIYILMGCLLEGFSMMVLTLPIIFPLILELGFDPIWFGIVVVMLIEVAQITPPIGINLFVLQTITGEQIGTIVKSSIPFFLILLLAIVIITLFPNIALWLPSTMMSG